MKLHSVLTAWAFFLGAVASLHADVFGPISVVPQAIVSGDTYHGYRELRVFVENRSLKDKHEVLLIYPDRSFNYGNSIGRIVRRVSLAPGTSVQVPIWQPPLPLNGSAAIKVIVDGEAVGEVSTPSLSHMNRSHGHYSGALLPAVILVSRSLNYDELNRVLKAQNDGYQASMAVGAPTSMRTRGMVPTAWSPNSTSGSGPHWIELEYATPIKADKLRIYDTLGANYYGSIVLTDVSGTNVTKLPFSHGMAAPRTAREIFLPAMSEAIKTVRLEIGPVYAGMVSIDAVELAGPSESAFATSATASSEGGVLSPGASGATRDANSLLRAESSVAEWSDAWLSYSAFDGIAVSAGDLKSMPAAVQTAVQRYVECGGMLLVFGGGEIPSAWRSMHVSETGDSLVVHAGLGRCFMLASVAPANLSGSTRESVLNALATSSREWQSIPDEETANASFPVIDNIKIPVQGIVVIMLAFVITIGPVNIILLSKRNRRTWLLWTIPAISIVTTLLVFVYSFLREGVTPDVRIDGLTFLDQQNRRAATWGRAAFYCPLTPGGGLLFGSDTEATPMVGVFNYRHGTSREMDWTHGQRLSRGWVSARVPAHFQIRKSEVARERLQLEGAGTDRHVVNGLGAEIRSLWIADQQGRVFHATNVPAGGKVRLTHVADRKVESASSDSVRTLQEKYFNSMTEAEWQQLAAGSLWLNSYVAKLEGNPFIENGLRSKSARVKARSVVFGQLESTPNPQP